MGAKEKIKINNIWLTCEAIDCKNHLMNVIDFGTGSVCSLSSVRIDSKGRCMDYKKNVPFKIDENIHNDERMQWHNGL